MSTPGPTTNSKKAASIAALFRAQIKAGEINPGDRLPSFTEMRTRFGSAPNTIDRAYAELEREGLVRREQGRGTFVAHRTRPRRYAIGCYGFDPRIGASGYWSQLMVGIREVAEREELEVTLLNPRSLRGLEFVDGILLHGAVSTEYLQTLPTGIPAVGLIESIEGISSVLADDFSGSMAATRHLLDLEHRRIAFFMFVNSAVVQRRLAGYSTALQKAGIPADPALVRSPIPMGGANLREDCYLYIKQWLKTDWHETGCTAIFCQNDLAAAGACQALREAGLRVPEDVSVVGFDGTEEGELTTPRLTSVGVPLAELGAQAATLLLQEIHLEKKTRADLTLPTTLVIRESTARAPQIETHVQL